MKEAKKNIPGKVCSSISAASMADKTNWRSFSMFINTSMHVNHFKKRRVETESRKSTVEDRGRRKIEGDETVGINGYQRRFESGRWRV